MVDRSEVLEDRHHQKTRMNSLGYPLISPLLFSSVINVNQQLQTNLLFIYFEQVITYMYLPHLQVLEYE